MTRPETFAPNSDGDFPPCPITDCSLQLSKQVASRQTLLGVSNLMYRGSDSKGSKTSVLVTDARNS